jgi:Family of unknown function (DUF6290)
MSERTTDAKPTSMISVRLTPEQAELLKNTADARGESLSEYVREAALYGAIPVATHISVSGGYEAGGPAASQAQTAPATSTAGAYR